MARPLPSSGEHCGDREPFLKEECPGHRRCVRPEDCGAVTKSLSGPFQVAKEFGFQNNGFSVYVNRNKTGEITASSNKSLNLLKIK